ncbi:phosphoglycerate mutase-like protein [Amylostereum chailletii]|nr:phosphoglycerate mutase-like protein [Amylostereum chailletii]
MVVLRVGEIALLAAGLVLQASASAFNPLHHSGPASPYFDAPSQFGIDASTPSGCVVDQAAYILRHGSRFPEPGSFKGWQTLFQKIQNATFTARGPLAFLGAWVPPVDDIPHEPLYLTSTGAREAFELGVQRRQKYGLTKGGDNLTVWAASQQRVLDTASYFLRGYLSQGNYLNDTSANRGTTVALPDSVNYTYANSLTPSSSCPLYSTGDKSSLATAYRASYRGAVAARLNGYLSGLTLDATDVGVMQDLCGFQAALDGDTRFCEVFTETDWLNYEYAHDLNYYYGSGPGNAFAGATGFPWVQTVNGLFQRGPKGITPNATFSPPPLLMSFTHDNNIPPIIAALGLWNESSVSPLNPSTPDTRRHFRSSYLVSFRGYVALERLACSAPLKAGEVVQHVAGVVNAVAGTGSNVAHYVRVRTNNAPVPIPDCTSGPGSTCPLAAFGEYVSRRGSIVGDFVTTCGLQNASNATSAATFFTNPPSSAQPLPL